MGLMEKLKELVGEYDVENEDSTEDGSIEAEQQDVDESTVGNKPEPKDEAAKASTEEAASPSKGSEVGNAEKSKQEESMQDNKDSKLEELQAKIEKLEAEVAKSKGGTTGLPSAGAATTTESDMKRWREIAGLDD